MGDLSKTLKENELPVKRRSFERQEIIHCKYRLKIEFRISKFVQFLSLSAKIQERNKLKKTDNKAVYLGKWNTHESRTRN